MIIIYIIFGLMITAMIMAVIETRILRVTHYEIIADCPSDQDEKTVRIAIVSDLHCTRFGKKNKRLIDKIAGQKADFLIVAGDVINSRPGDLRYAVEFFDGLRNEGVEAYYFFGNHEQKLVLYGENELQIFENEMKSHVRIVNNDTVEVKGTVLKGLLIPLRMYRDSLSNIAGYFDATGLAGSFCDDGKYHILVAHDPTFVDYYRDINADLTIGGHLHGGIIRLPFVGGLISPRHRLFPGKTKGLYDEGNGKLLVTSGVGWHALPFRFLNDPQIVILEIKMRR